MTKINQEEQSDSIDFGAALKKSKKYIYATGIAISIIGIVCLGIFTFLVNDSIDKAHEITLNNIESTSQNLQNAKDAADTIELQIGSLNSTIDEVKGSIAPLSQGIESTSVSINAIASAAAGFSSFGLGQGAINQLNSASVSLHQSALMLNQSSATLQNQKELSSQLKDNVHKISLSIGSQKDALDSSKEEFETIFNNMKLANALFFVIIFGMLSILGINSAAGII